MNSRQFLLGFAGASLATVCVLIAALAIAAGIDGRQPGIAFLGLALAGAGAAVAMTLAVWLEGQP